MVDPMGGSVAEATPTVVVAGAAPAGFICGVGAAAQPHTVMPVPATTASSILCRGRLIMASFRLSSAWW